MLQQFRGVAALARPFDERMAYAVASKDFAACVKYCECRFSPAVSSSTGMVHVRDLIAFMVAHAAIDPAVDSVREQQPALRSRCLQRDGLGWP